MGQQSCSGGFPAEINKVPLPGMERRSPGHCPVVDHYNRGVQTDDSHSL